MNALIQRRDFLKLLGLAVSGAALPGCRVRPRPSLPAARVWLDYKESRLPSACTQCGGGCGIIARVVDGCVVKLDGNPLHPVNRGRLCAVGQAGIQLLYHPDRFKSPIKRVRSNQSESEVRIGWPEAIDIVASYLKMLRGRGEPQSLLILDGRPNTLEEALWTRFCDAFGSPNYFAVRSPDQTALAAELMHGQTAAFGYDLENSNYILSFGCDLFEGWRSPVDAIRTYAYLRQERPGPKAKLVQIDRRFSTAAAKSDEWVPVRPLTEGALALAMAHVIVKEELYDRNFVGSSTSGFEDWKTFVLKERDPDTVAAMTGVPASTIIRIAREFAQSRPSVAISDLNFTSTPNGTQTALAIHALNALVGSINARGGVFIAEAPPLKLLPAFDAETGAETGRRRQRIDYRYTERFPLGRGNVEAIPDAILSGLPYPIRAVFLRNFDPISSTRVSARFRRALEAVPLVVSFASLPDASTELADLVLPDCTYLEKWIGANVSSMSGVPVFNVAAPVIEPLYETMQTEDFILQLAHALDQPIASAFPWKNYEELLHFVSEGIYDRHGQPEAASYEDFWNSMLKQGGWWPSRSFRAAPLNAASGKFEFYPHLLGKTTGRKNDDQYPFFLNPVGLSIDCSSLPWIQEIKSAASQWDFWVEIHPHAASDLRIKTGQWVWIETPRGKLKTRARVYPGAMPGVINVPGEQTAIKNILELTYDRLSGAPAWFATRAKISKAQ